MFTLVDENGGRMEKPAVIFALDQIHCNTTQYFGKDV